MFRQVIDCAGRSKMEFVPCPDNYERIETGDITLDISKLQRITSWSPKVSLEEGLSRTFEYYRKNMNSYL